MEQQGLIQLAFALCKTVDELEAADQYWLSRMLLDSEARDIASAQTEQKYHERLRRLIAREK